MLPYRKLYSSVERLGLQAAFLYYRAQGRPLTEDEYRINCNGSYRLTVCNVAVHYFDPFRYPCCSCKAV